MRYRVAQRRAAHRSGLTQALGPGEKLSSVVGFGNCIALCVSCVLLGRRWSVVRASLFTLRMRRFGQRGCAAAKRMD